MAIDQLSVYVENKQGKLAAIVQKIGDAGINIRAMSIADTKDFGILRLIVSDVSKAKEVLSAENVVNYTEVVAAKMDDKVGALTTILNVLDAKAINIDYMYAFTGTADIGAYVVLRVSDVSAAEEALKQNGIPTLTRQEIAKL